MNGRKRKIQIKFYVTEEERALIEQKMKLVPTRNMAAYLRKIAIDGYIIQIDHADIKAMTAEIQKIGVNVNQIARRVNATGNAYQEDIEEIKGVLEVKAEKMAKKYDCAFVDNEMPYGRVPQGHPVIVDYFYHEEIRGTENTGKRNR